MTDAEKAKAQRQAKAGFTAHVNLIMVQDALSKPDALYVAYTEGSEGLAKRMAPPAQGELLVKQK